MQRQGDEDDQGGGQPDSPEESQPDYALHKEFSRLKQYQNTNGQESESGRSSPTEQEGQPQSQQASVSLGDSQRDPDETQVPQVH